MAQQGQSYGTTTGTSGTSNLGTPVRQFTDYVLPPSSRQRSFKLGIALTILSAIVIIFGAACFDYRIYDVLRFSGINVWGGMLYAFTGSLSIASHYNPLNYYITHAYYCSSIVSTLTAFIQFVLAAVSFRRKKFIWFKVLSLLMSLPAFALSLGCFLILYRNIYSNKHYSSNTGNKYSNFSNENHGVPPQTQPVPSSTYIGTSNEA